MGIGHSHIILWTLTFVFLAMSFVGQGSASPDRQAGEDEVWGRALRLEGNQTLVVEDPAGLEVKLQGEPRTFQQVRRGDLIKALVDQQGKIRFLEVVDYGQTRTDPDPTEKSKE
jgi:hypothetical protein